MGSREEKNKEVIIMRKTKRKITSPSIKVRIWFGSKEFLNLLKRKGIRYEYDKDYKFVYIW